jgi:hypothetical protein
MLEMLLDSDYETTAIIQVTDIDLPGQMILSLSLLAASIDQGYSVPVYRSMSHPVFSMSITLMFFM